MKRLVRRWLCHLREYLWWHIGVAFLVIVCVSCGLFQAWMAEELAPVFTQLTLWIILRGLFRELWCFALLLLCMVHWVGVPVAVAVLALRAYVIGFAWGWWLSVAGFGGWLAFFFLLLPQGVLVLVALSAAVCIGLAHAFRVKPLNRREYICAILLCCLPALAALLLEWLAVGLVL